MQNAVTQLYFHTASYLSKYLIPSNAMVILNGYPAKLATCYPCIKSVPRNIVAISRCLVTFQCSSQSASPNMGTCGSRFVDPVTTQPEEEPAEVSCCSSEGDQPSSFPKQHLSRSHHRAGKRLNNTLVDDSPKRGHSDVVEQAQSDFEMERRFLRLHNDVPIGRCSSPTRIKCFHCAHEHGKRCCLYLGDDPGDATRYAKWKKHLDCGVVRLGHFPRVPEAVSGGCTPNWFPKGTLRNRRDILRRMCELNPPLPTVYFRRYTFPLMSNGKDYKMLQKRVRKMTPREEYQREIAKRKRMDDAYKPVMISLHPKPEQAIEAVETDYETFCKTSSSE